MEKALKAFEEGSSKNVDCQALLENTFQTFSLLERWETAESKVTLVQSIISQVQEQGHAYFRTLDDSISVAVRLYVLAQDVVHLVGFLLDPHCKPREIKDFIADMKNSTHDALENSQRISKAYRIVRKGINEISENIPGAMAKLERREARIVAEKESLDRAIERAKVVKTVGTTALAVVSGVAIVSLPPLVLILPVALPIAILALEVYENRSSKKAKKRETQIMDYRAGLNELQNVTLCLAALAQHVDSLIDWWIRSDTILETVSSSVERIRGSTARLRLEAIRKQWESAGALYLDYVTKLKKIQTIDCGATSSLRSRPSSTYGTDSSRSDKGADRPRDQKIIVSTSMDEKLDRRNAINPRSSPRHSKH